MTIAWEGDTRQVLSKIFSNHECHISIAELETLTLLATMAII